MRSPVNVCPFAADRLPSYLIGLGLGLTAVMVGEVVLFFSIDPTIVTDGGFLVGTVSTAPFLIGITHAGYWLRSSELSSERYPRIACWCFGSFATFLLVNTALIVAMPAEPWTVIVSWIRWAVALGAGTGLLIGCIEGRAVERALTAERAALRSEHVAEQRDYLDYLNDILRHEVLNTATIINGYSSRVLETESALDDRSRRWLEIVIDESEDMSTVIDDVRVLLQTTEGSYRPERVDAARVLVDEVRKLEHKWESIDVETSIPDHALVHADDLLARIFRNLLSNAIEHNDAATPRVAVSVDSSPETVRFEIADNGPGIPESKLDTLFDRVESRGSTHGLGLYLVSQLVARYDGRVELAETGSDGSRFTVELPAASSDRADDSLDATPTAALVLP